MRASSFRLKVQDPDLKEGRVEMMTIQAKIGSYERPWGLQGGFAIVYKFCTKSGQFRALRCFIKRVDSETEFRYGRIGPYFQTHIPELTAGFRYHDTGILLREKGQEHIYPVIEMEWIEGMTLFDKVNELCGKRDRVALQRIGQQWLELLQKMRQAHIAHGDLAAANVMVRPDGNLVLIDYDGVYIPEFAGRKQMVSGQADYQHPQMSHRRFAEGMDDFSALVIYTALLALAISPELWNKHMQQGKFLDTNLLFTERDFKDPHQSALFQELLHLHDQRVRDVAQELVHACLQPIDQIRFPLHIIDPDYEKKLALQRLRSALQMREIASIAAAYTPGHTFFQELTPQERQQAEAAHTFVQVCAGSDDHAISTAYDTIQRLPFGNAFIFTPQQQQRLTLAKERTEALTTFRSALTSKSLRQIINAYKPVLDQSTAITLHERSQLALGLRLIKAYDHGSDDELILAADALQASPHQSVFVLTPAEQQHVANARQRKAALLKFRDALRTGLPGEIVVTYDPVLDTCKDVTPQEYIQLSLARSFVQAYKQDDDDALIRLRQELQQKNVTFAFTAEQQQRIDLAMRRSAALETFHRAWNNNTQSADQLLAAYDGMLLDESSSITPEQRARIEDARSCLQMYQEVHAAILADDDDAIRRAFDKRLDQLFPSFNSTERQRINKAMQVVEVKQLLDNKDYEPAIRLARRIVIDSRKEIDEFLKLGLHTATMRFIRKLDVTGLQVHIEENTWTSINHAEAHWRWPFNDLVQDALLVWRTDTWPQRPREKCWQDPEWHHIELRRKSSEDSHTFSIGRATHIYVQIFTRILDEWDYEHAQWRYSDGLEPSSQSEAGSERITWRTYS